MSQSQRERREAAQKTYRVQQPDSLCANCRHAELHDDTLHCLLLRRPVADLGLCAAWQGE
jgi:hypothetical protein